MPVAELVRKEGGKFSAESYASLFCSNKQVGQ